MTSADVRSRLTHALRLDLIGPESDEPQVSEVLPIAPSRWYLTGFLVPWNAPAQQKRDEEDTQGELEFGEAGAGSDDESGSPEPRAARRSHFPSSIGLSVLVLSDATELMITARWGDYHATERDGTLTGEWRRTERSERVVVRLAANRANPPVALVPDSNGLEVVTSVRRVRGAADLPGLPQGTRAVSVFLVKRWRIAGKASSWRLADALGSGRLGADFSAFSIAKAADSPHPLVDAVLELKAEGISPAHLCLLLDAAASAAEARVAHVEAELVWTGPEVGVARSRDTAVVVRELFGLARRDVLASTFVVRQAGQVFRPLADRMDLVPELRVRLFLHVSRQWRDTTLESELLREFAEELGREWPSATGAWHGSNRSAPATGAAAVVWPPARVVSYGQSVRLT